MKTKLNHKTDSIPEIQFQMERTVEAGCRFHVCSTSFRLFHSCTLAAVQVEGKKDALSIVKEGSQPIRDAMKHSLGTIQAEESIPKGSWVQVTLLPAKEMLNVAGDLEWDLRLSIINEQEFEANICRFPYHDLAQPVTLHLTADSATQLEAYRRFNGELIVRTSDSNGITSPLEASKVKASVGTDTVLIDCQPGHGSAHISTDFEENISVEMTSGNWQTRSNPLPRLPHGEAVFFGDIHWHTELSTDGQRSLNRALAFARDDIGLDFAGPSDHALDEGDYGRATVRDQVAICERYNEAGKFAVIPGFEISRQYGHCNVYTTDFEKLIRLSDRFPDEFSPRIKQQQGVYGLDTIVSLFEDENTLIIPHHTNMDNAAGKGKPGSVPAWAAFHWPHKKYPQHLRLIEINQQRGAFESEVPDPLWQPAFWKQFSGGLGGSAQTGLARGHRIGFIGGTDNHNGYPTLEGNGGRIGGITGVIASDLSSESIVKALHARRCYATTGARMVATASLNDQLIGSEMELGMTAERAFTISIRGTAPIETVEIISFGQVAHSFEVTGKEDSFSGEWSDDRPERPVEDVYYYVRARQSDGHCLWMSPWWIDLKL